LTILIVSKVTLHVKARKGAYMHEVLGESALFIATHNIAYLHIWLKSLTVILSCSMSVKHVH